MLVVSDIYRDVTCVDVLQHVMSIGGADHTRYATAVSPLTPLGSRKHQVFIVFYN